MTCRGDGTLPSPAMMEAQTSTLSTAGIKSFAVRCLVAGVRRSPRAASRRSLARAWMTSALYRSAAMSAGATPAAARNVAYQSAMWTAVVHPAV